MEGSLEPHFPQCFIVGEGGVSKVLNVVVSVVYGVVHRVRRIGQLLVLVEGREVVEEEERESGGKAVG